MSGTPGVLIAFEGIDGAGKTTQSKRLDAHLRALGRTAIWTREPTSGKFGQRIRELAAGGRDDVTARDELALFLDDRREHVAWLETARREHDAVICDRYFFSTAAYQGARGIDPAEIYRLHEGWAPVPALTIVLDVDPAEGLRRVRESRGETPNLFEREEPLTKARAIFLAIPKKYPRTVIDGAAPPDAVFATVLSAVEGFIPGLLRR